VTKGVTTPANASLYTPDVAIGVMLVAVRVGEEAEDVELNKAALSAAELSLPPLLSNCNRILLNRSVIKTRLI
jgi:hypothetical protein